MKASFELDKKRLRRLSGVIKRSVRARCAAGYPNLKFTYRGMSQQQVYNMLMAEKRERETNLFRRAA